MIDGSNMGLEELGKYEPPTLEEEQELLDMWLNGSEDEKAFAREQLVLRNGRLVISIAKKFAYGYVPLVELCQEGVIGLMRAIEKFDPEKGYRLSTYATWWIRQAVSRATTMNRKIRLPVHVSDLQRRISGVSKKFEAETGRNPTLNELTDLLDEKPEKIERAMGLKDAISLQWLVYGQNDETELQDFIGEEFEMTEEVEYDEMTQHILDVLETLPARHEKILRLRFGLDDGEYKTLESVAERYGLTRERIRQIEKEALRLIAEDVDEIHYVE